MRWLLLLLLVSVLPLPLLLAAPSAHAESRVRQDDTGSSLPPSDEPDGTVGSPAFLLLLLGLVSFCVFLILALAGLAVVAVTVAFALMLLGVFSTSAVIAFIRRSPEAGVRALVVQTCVAAGIVTAIGATWLATWGLHQHWSMTSHLFLGMVSGSVCGLAVAGLLNLAWRRVAAWSRTAIADAMADP